MRLLTANDVADFVRWEKERPYPWTEANFLETLSGVKVQTHVWEETGHRVGFAVVQVIETEAYLQNIMVDPSRRRQGFGEKILQKVMMWARHQGASELLLDVEANNDPAVRLYKKAGFIVLEQRKNSYPQGEDALVMKCAL